MSDPIVYTSLSPLLEEATTIPSAVLEAMAVAVGRSLRAQEAFGYTIVLTETWTKESPNGKSYLVTAYSTETCLSTCPQPFCFHGGGDREYGFDTLEEAEAKFLFLTERPDLFAYER